LGRIRGQRILPNPLRDALQFECYIYGPVIIKKMNRKGLRAGLIRPLSESDQKAFTLFAQATPLLQESGCENK